VVVKLHPVPLVAKGADALLKFGNREGIGMVVHGSWGREKRGIKEAAWQSYPKKALMKSHEGLYAI
jgi:hypothetical protein